MQSVLDLMQSVQNTHGVHVMNVTTSRPPQYSQTAGSSVDSKNNN